MVGGFGIWKKIWLVNLVLEELLMQEILTVAPCLLLLLRLLHPLAPHNLA